MGYRFDECELDMAEQQLRRHGELVNIEPQVFDLLACFVTNPGRLISHDELVQTVWNGRVVSDSAIAARISAARKAIGDDGKAQRLIETVPRRGYRFLATVDQPQNDVIEPLSRPEQSTDSNRLAHQLDHQDIHFSQSVDGTRIAYASTGSGRPLVRTGHWLTHLEHDWHSPIWRPFLDEMGRRFNVIRYDQRGCGLSDREITDFSFPRFVQDLEAVIDASGHERFILYATSQGVPVAIDYCVRNPGRVSHLVLHGGYARGRLVRDKEADLEQGEAIIKLIEHGWGVTDSPFLKAFTTMYIPDANREQMDSLVELQRLTTNTHNAVAIRRAVDSFDVASLLPEVAAKTLVMHAAHDGVHPVDQGRDLAAGIAGSEFVLLESENHAILPQEPAWKRFFWELERFTSS
jgi:DNA-binding winged helix-turn-helix (wHTH) protein/pimeloyl-ACP methyl ester carboxylesterase